MKIILSEENKRIAKNKRKLEQSLEVKIFFKEKDIFVVGEADAEYLAEKVIEAINFGFPIEDALLIKNEDFLFEILNIKDYTSRRDFETIRARIIGKQGRTLRTLTQLTDCHFQIKMNQVGIIGASDKIKNSQEAVISIIRGSKQANVYNFLEKHPIEPIFDFGLKEEKKKIPEKEEKPKEKIKEIKPLKVKKRVKKLSKKVKE